MFMPENRGDGSRTVLTREVDGTGKGMPREENQPQMSEEGMSEDKKRSNACPEEMR
jgi:hypothetical protein